MLRPLAETEQEAIGSMGDDIPMAVLSRQRAPLYDCFRQAFAQVTNPPIDPLREDCVMTLATQIGREGNLFEDGAGQRRPRHPQFAGAVAAQAAPVAGAAAVRRRRTRYIDLYFRGDGSPRRPRIERLCAEAEAAARAGTELLVLSDRRPRRETAAMHALLATGAVHQHLVRARPALRRAT